MFASCFLPKSIPSVSYRQILSFSSLHPPGGYSCLGGHVHGPGSILQRYLTQTPRFVFRYPFIYVYIHTHTYVCVYKYTHISTWLYVSQTFVLGLVINFGEFSPGRSIGQLPNTCSVLERNHKNQ